MQKGQINTPLPELSNSGSLPGTARESRWFTRMQLSCDPGAGIGNLFDLIRFHELQPIVFCIQTIEV